MPLQGDELVAESRRLREELKRLSAQLGYFSQQLIEELNKQGETEGDNAEQHTGKPV